MKCKETKNRKKSPVVNRIFVRKNIKIQVNQGTGGSTIITSQSNLVFCAR